ncbi:SGNH/GDSL hydrolase family protein [Planctomicrobium piriforme]|uniref:Lysophospholipase L1 n=1 Tax=Planctomicrobium piriforme TaxID=1576369 RepID=A0A1I3F8W8_9PLAN|nr:SGNH/GDSL hydrolase family protein [Planctomicrobium piriforme]SFI07652.1 Lysophospholipase L1 [Planctomicrobium piriforme]
MRSHCTVLLLSSLIFAPLTALAADPFPLNAKAIVFLGDSITAAGHYIDDVEVQLRLAGHDAPQLINLGLSSETVTGLSEPGHPFPRPDVHERLTRVLDKLHPEVVVACYGMNDGIYHPFSEERFAAYQAGINNLIKAVHASGAKLILMTPPPFDPAPLKSSGKLLPAAASGYGYNGVYENYDSEVIARYASWIMSQANKVEMVIDLYAPVLHSLAEHRVDDPDFAFAKDGVHLSAAGHQILAQAILDAWHVPNVPQPDAELAKLVAARQSILHAAWLSDIGHKRPGIAAGLPIEQAQKKAADLDQQIKARRDAIRPQ